ncbi:tetratricopeptide repeat protein [Micromonospora wenchangensis]
MLSAAADTVQNSGAAKADHGGFANTGIMGDVTVERHEHHHYPQALPPPVWPIQVGRPPALASAFQPRRGLREKIQGARDQGADVVLTQPEAPAQAGTRVLAGGGGVGKSQLAAWFARQALDEQTADLVVWANASSTEQVITAYARAALLVRALGADGTDQAADATLFCEWLHTTERAWLIVLDDITDPAALAGWWPPHRPTGWTLATTRRRDAALATAGRHRIDIDVYSPAESVAYLTDRLASAGYGGLLDAGVQDLAVAVGHLPLALSHAAAYMIDQEVGCADYLVRYTTAERLAEVMPITSDPDDYGRSVALTLLLALDAADPAVPVGLARPALALAAVLDPDGHPDTLWASTAVTTYLSDYARRPVTAEQARQALRLLHRYGLLTHASADGPRAVRIHALTARAAREASTINPATVARAAAGALLDLWPDHDHAAAELVGALRTNTTILAKIAGDRLWEPDGHPLLYRAGISMLRAGQHIVTVGYWRRMVDDSMRLLGEEHPSTVTAWANLAASYWQAGRTVDAIVIEEKVVDDRVRLLGEEHPDTVTARANLATSYWQAGRTADAIIIQEKVVGDYVRLLGEEYLDTLTARANLAGYYRRAGRTADAIIMLEKIVGDFVRLLGEEHPSTLTAWSSLATSYGQAGRTADAISIREKVVDDRVRLLGEEHPDTVTARANLAVSYEEAGRTADAIIIQEKVVDDYVRLLGEEHPHTVTARANLAVSYGQAGRTADAIYILEKVVGDYARLLGEAHPDTVTATHILRALRAKG